jgi:hypothetical protein
MGLISRTINLPMGAFLFWDSIIRPSIPLGKDLISILVLSLFVFQTPSIDNGLFATKYASIKL